MVPMTDTRTILLLHGVQSSQLTWWRLTQDLQDLGWEVHAVDLLGHGSRNAVGPSDLSVDDLARDVLSQVPGPVNILAGHSLGSVVALTIVGLAPGYCDRVVIEDPPAISDTPMEHDVVGNLEEAIRATRADPAGTLRALLEDNPLWSYRDAENSVTNRLNFDLERVVRFLRTTRWDVEQLVERCPVPVSLLAATQGSTLGEPARSALMSRLPTERVAVVDSGHTVHRERPGLWLHHVLRFAETT
jgi:pimeloyl-ACP methyl ester carboxylesterase